MAKTKEELNAIKEEVETLSRKLAELSDEDLEQVSGGIKIPIPDIWISYMKCNYCQRNVVWRGKYDNGKKYMCVCNKVELECQRVRNLADKLKH